MPPRGRFALPIESFDYLVLRLLLAGRTDVTIRRYVGRDHSYVRAGEKATGTPFEAVIREVLDWADGRDPPAETAPLR